ncbi:MAG: AMIN domain-containing protein [Ruminococcaceae bacterium]|nr:AMIN domain-containing protein [Oscillospiraceae bacterium]
MIKRGIQTAVVFIMLFLISIGSAEAMELFYDGQYHTYEGNIFKLVVNDTLLEPPIPPIVFSDYSVVPARAVFEEGLGATVTWDGEAQKVTVKLDTMKLVMTIGKRDVIWSGQRYTMPIAPKIINGHTMIPARYVAETLGMTVDFDSATDTIFISNKKPVPPVIEEPEENEKGDNTVTETVLVTSAKFTQKNDDTATLTLVTDAEKPTYNAFLLSDPTRLVLDVQGGQFSPMPSVIEMEKGNIAKIRFGQQADSARVVVDLVEDLGYKVSTKGRSIILTLSVDMKVIPTITDIFKLVSYGAEGGRDYIKVKDLEIGKVSHIGNQLIISVSGENLPVETQEKTVTGYFGRKLVYTPDDLSGESGRISVTLKTSDMEYYTQDDEVRIKSRHKAMARSVTLDAGHGGVDGGAVAYDEDGEILAKEKDFNLDIALRAQELLEDEGVEVHMIRTEDVYVDYLRVGSIANDAGTSLFVSIHTNSAETQTPHGIETYGYLQGGSVANDMTSERLSEILLNAMVEETDAHSRGVKDGKTLAVVNSTKMPATLVEIGFISNPEECALMMTEEYRQKLAEAICKGVLEAFEEMDI